MVRPRALATLRSEDLVRVKSVVKLLAGSNTVVRSAVRVSTIAEIWNISTRFNKQLFVEVKVLGTTTTQG